LNVTVISYGDDSCITVEYKSTANGFLGDLLKQKDITHSYIDTNLSIACHREHGVFLVHAVKQRGGMEVRIEPHVPSALLLEYLLCRRLCETHRRSRRFGGDNSFVPVPGIKPLFTVSPSCNLISVLTALSLLPVSRTVAL